MNLNSTQIPADDSMSVQLIAGVTAGIVGFLVFLVLHQLWIAPIWFILPIGLVIAAIGGLAVGWAYHELSPHLPTRPWTTFAVVALIGVILAPAIILGEVRQPLFNVTEMGSELSVSVGYATVVFILELLVSSTLVGGLAGWLIGRSSRAALSTAIAGLVFALGPGHNIPFLGNTPGTLKGIVILLAVILPAAFILVGSSIWRSGRAISNNEQE